MKHIRNIADAFSQLAQSQKLNGERDEQGNVMCVICGNFKAWPTAFEGHGSLNCKACVANRDEMDWRE